MIETNFNLYTTDDFVLDEDFREIVRESDSNDRLKELLEAFPEKRREIKLAVHIIKGIHVEKLQQSDKRKQEQWQQILNSQSRQIRYLVFKVAASILLLIGAGSAIFYATTSQKADNVAIVANIPATNNAILILGNGKKISISSKQSTIKYSADGLGIMVNDTSGIAQPVSDEGMNQLIVPYGKRSYIKLSEGTKVWLNSGSKLTFPPVFKGETREVYLEGEALFDVTKDKEKPFFVKTDAFRMKVYGTRFNVQAYQQDKDYKVVLIEGKVSMNAINNLTSDEVFLVPSQKATISMGKTQIDVVNVENTGIYTAWVDGYLAFTNENVGEILKRVSRYYNVSIETELPDNIEKIYGKLDLKDNLERVLDGIAFISETKYEKKGDKYIFKKN